MVQGTRRNFESKPLRAMLWQLSMIVALLALSNCSQYDIQNAISDQDQFNEAFGSTDVERMTILNMQYRKGVRTISEDRKIGNMCNAKGLHTTQAVARRLQVTAINWSKQKSMSNAFQTHKELEKHLHDIETDRSGCSNSAYEKISKKLTDLIEAIQSDIVDEHQGFDKALADQRLSEAKRVVERRTNCELDLSEQKLIFQSFVQLEDINGLDRRPRTVKELSKRYKIAQSCVELIVRLGIHYPDWMPEPL